MAEKISANAIARDDITAVILAGGEGRRAGNRDKGTMTWNGKPLVAHVRDRLAPQVGRILVSCNRNADFYANYAEATFPDLRREYLGPVAGLEAAANHVDTDYVLIAPCDTPLLPLDLVQGLSAGIRVPGSAGCYARSGDRNHYLCALLRRSCLETAGDYLDSGGRTVRHWFAELGISAVVIKGNADAFCNINRPEGQERS